MAPKTTKVPRTTFTTSRLLDFCSKKELVAQTAHQPDDWPLVALKELLDNALDACEEAGVPPVINITVDEQGIAVSDNGPGINPATVEGTLDFSVRVSSREAYVAPDRGKQGNALKTLVAMPFVLHGQEGRVEVAAKGVRHVITMTADKIRQAPEFDHRPKPDEGVNNGTTVRLCWPQSACSLLRDAEARFLQLAEGYTFLNPHLTLGVTWFGSETRTYATNPEWPKWRPHHPSSPHWYSDEAFERLVTACIAHDATRGTDLTVRAFIAQFDGMTSPVKQKEVLEEVGLKRMYLSALANGNGVDSALVARLLAVMKGRTRPVKPKSLGLIGKDHLAERFRALGCQMESFTFRPATGVTGGLPRVVEAAFAHCPDADERRLVTGVNWSPGILNPFRQLGQGGPSLDDVLAEQKAGPDEPVIILFHVASPGVQFTDRGKSAVVIAGDARGQRCPLVAGATLED
jgi:DNA topoisomerase VI subunit B